MLLPLQKPGKTEGKVENLRPIILLSQLRKVLAIVMLRRIFEKLDAEIPISQCAYRPGRSTTENMFTFKILAEKAMTATNYDINLILFDMSKAFDNVRRDILLDDLRKIVNEDELHILKILLKEVIVQVRNGRTIGDEFSTNIGVSFHKETASAQSYSHCI